VCGSDEIFGETDHGTWQTVIEDEEYQPPVELEGMTVPRLTEVIEEVAEGLLFLFALAS
jgi:hypothetical protein